MFRLFMLINLLLTPYNNIENTDKTLEENNNYCYKEIEKTNVVCEDSGFELIFNNEYEIQSDKYLVNLGLVQNVKIKADEELNLYVTFVQNNEFIVQKYDCYGTLVYEGLLLQDLINEYDLYINNKELYIVGTIEDYYYINTSRFDLGKKDGIIIILDKDYGISIKLFGGKLNESFDKAFFVNNLLYIVGKKDSLSGGDFGYSGKSDGVVFICIIDQDLDIIDFTTLNNSGDILDLAYKNNMCYIMTTSMIYILSQKLELVNNSPAYSNGVFGVIGINEYNVVFFNNSLSYIKVYDNNLDLIKTIKNELNIKKYMKNSNYIYAESIDKAYLIDIFEEEDIIVNDVYYPNLDKVQFVDTLFTRTELKSKDYDKYFDPQIYGDYILTLLYKTNEGIEYRYTKKQNIPKECNVMEGNVYPLEYRLLFTGKAKLNGTDILNNYCLKDTGDYTLELISCDDYIETINFSVSDKQVEFFEMSNKNYDQKTTEDNIIINLKMNNYINVEVESVTINEVEYDNIKVNNDIITININKPETYGIHKYFIEKIKYKENEKEFEYKVNKVYNVNLIKKDPKFNVTNIDSNGSISISIEGNERIDNTMRYLEIIYSNFQEELIFKFPIVNMDLLINKLNEDSEYKVHVNIVYDVGDNVLYKEELIQGDFVSTSSSFVLGKMICANDKSRIDIKLSNAVQNNNLLNLAKDGKIVYEGNIIDYPLYIIIGVVLMIVAFISCIIVRILKKRKSEIRISI